MAAEQERTSWFDKEEHKEVREILVKFLGFIEVAGGITMAAAGFFALPSLIEKLHVETGSTSTGLEAIVEYAQHFGWLDLHLILPLIMMIAGLPLAQLGLDKLTGQDKIAQPE